MFAFYCDRVNGEMELISAIVLTGFVLLFAAAKGAYRFKVGPHWLRQLVMDPGNEEAA
jgi:hypothetical protein